MNMGRPALAREPLDKLVAELGYGFVRQKGGRAKIILPLRHALLAEEISRTLGIPVQRGAKSPHNSELVVKDAMDSLALKELLVAVNFAFCATDTSLCIVEPTLERKDTGFYIYQMVFGSSSSDTGQMGKQNQLIPRNAYIPLHSHQRTEETFRFMDPVKFYIDGKTICFPEGGEITVPVGSIHGTFPTENGIAKLLAEKPCLAPGDFYPAEKKPF